MAFRGGKALLLVVGILLTLGFTATLAVAGSGSGPGSGGNDDKRVTLAEADYDIEVEFRESRGLVVDVELEGASPGEYQVIMTEGDQQTVLGFVTVDAAGEADMDFPLDLGEGEHVVSFVIRNQQTTLMTTGGLSVQLPLANEAQASSVTSASDDREMEQEVEAGIEEDKDILDFETMFPVMGPWAGSANPIRGVNGGGLPWTIGEADGELRVNGRLEVKVEGLVLADDPSVPEALRLTNPIENFRGVLSCITHDADGNVMDSNVMTDLFPATPDGDAKIEAMIEIPMPCLAPVIFVTSPGGSWFAVTGN